jgi:tetratricopeptide (TPR) repeat protein
MIPSASVMTTAPFEIGRDREVAIPTAWIAFGLGLLTFAAFSPALWNDFVHWDDHVNIIRNRHYRGLGPAQLKWMFSTVLMGHWIPVTWLTFGLDYTLWGMKPLGYHLTSVLLHALDVALMYLVALRLLRAARTWPDRVQHAGAAVAALFFGLHPLRAESVAWVTERRDVLSMAFFLLSVLLYLRAQDDPTSRRRSIVFSLVSFALGLASKSMIMTLPAVLVILDVYPLRRIRFERGCWPTTRAVLLEKVPYAVLGVIGAALGYYGQQANHYFTSLDRYAWPARLAIVGASTFFYVWKTLLPIGLSPMYELPVHVGLLDMRFGAPWLAVGALTAMAVILRRRYPAILAGWACYLVMLAPVSGVAHAGYQLASDRYTYLPSLAFSMLVGAAFGGLLAYRGAARPAFVRSATGAIGALIATLGVLSWHQVQVWRDTGTLWTYAIESEPTCAVCHANLGVWLNNNSHHEGAVHHLGTALALRPDRTGPHLYMGMALVNAQRPQDGITHFEKRLAERPRDVDTLVALGVALIRQERYEEGRATLVRALEVNMKDATARLNYATAVAYLGRRDEAFAEHRRAIDDATDDEVARAHYAYASTLVKFGDLNGARAQLPAIGALDSKLAAQLAYEVSRKR